LMQEGLWRYVESPVPGNRGRRSDAASSAMSILGASGNTRAEITRAETANNALTATNAAQTLSAIDTHRENDQ